MPVRIAEIHDIMEKIKKGEFVDQVEIVKLIRQVLKDRSNYGIWIKKVKEEENGNNYISLVLIGENLEGKRRVVGYRIEIKRK